MTERASPSPECRHAAISRPFVRAILSLRLRFTGSVLALSGAPRQLSQRESLWRRGKALRYAKASPLGRGGCEADGEGKPISRVPPCSDKQALCQSDTIAAPALHRQRPCLLRRSAPRPGCGSQRLLRCRLHPAGRCPNSSSLFPPLAAVVAVAPKGEPLHPVKQQKSTHPPVSRERVGASVLSSP